MSELQFPKDPIVGQEYDFPPYRYYWDGIKWKTKGIGYNPVNDLRDELEPRVSNNESKTFETLKRSYADAGLNLVEGSFEEGGELLVATDVMITASGAGYSWGGPEFPHNVAPGTDPTLPGGGYVPRTDVVLRSELASAQGAAAVHHGDGSVADALGSARPLSYYGTDSAALVSLLTYAKDTGESVRLTSDVTVDTVIDIDFLGARLIIDFAGNSLLSDTECLVLRNLGAGSEIRNPSLKNITAPWCITRWSGDDWITNSATILASIKQTNEVGYYQPSSNDNDIWSSLPSSVQNQNISAKMRIVGSSDIKVYSPRGRFCLYEFDMCHRCEVFNPDIESGGKGTYGTILFKNLGDTSYGLGNKVHGGRVAYGTFSSVGFMRNKKGGVDGGFVPYRCGESGVKTYQGEVSGRSARCYGMSFSDIFPYQTVFDGVDFNADYGTSSERIDDYTLAQYPWNQLPTAHTVRNIQSNGCRQLGVWGDGQFNNYESVSGTNCRLTGVWLKVTNSNISDASANECNTSNTGGYNQITIEGNGNTVSDAFVATTNAITAGVAIYIYGDSVLIDERVVGAITSISAPLHGTRRVDKLIVGSDLASENDVAIDLHPRGRYLANGAAELSGVLQIGSSGAETGYGELKGRAAGTLVHGVKALPDAGGIGLLAVGTSINGSWLANSEIVFYQNGTSIVAVCKLADGTVKTATVIA